MHSRTFYSQQLQRLPPCPVPSLPLHSRPRPLLPKFPQCSRWVGPRRPPIRINQVHFDLRVLLPNLVRDLLCVQVWQIPVQQHAVARPLQQLRQRVCTAHCLFAHHIRIRWTPLHAIPKQRVSARHQNPTPRSHHAWCRRGRHVLPHIPDFNPCLAALSIRPPRCRQDFRTAVEQAGHTPCDFVAKVFRNGNVARTGFAQIDERAHRAVSELCPGEERNRPASSAVSLPPDDVAPSRCAHPPLASSIDHARADFSDFFLIFTHPNQLLEQTHDRRLISYRSSYFLRHKIVSSQRNARLSRN